MFVKVSCICGKQIRVLAVKKGKQQKETSVNILFLSLDPTWRGLNNMTMLYLFGDSRSWTKRQFHIFHNAPYWTPKSCTAFFIHFSWVLQSSQEKLSENNAYTKFFFWGGGGGNKVHFGQCGSGVFKAKKGSMVRGQIWDKIADNPHSLQHPQFRVTKRSVRERHTLLSDIFRAKTQNEKRQVE